MTEGVDWRRETDEGSNVRENCVVSSAWRINKLGKRCYNATLDSMRSPSRQVQTHEGGEVEAARRLQPNAYHR